MSARTVCGRAAAAAALVCLVGAGAQSAAGGPWRPGEGPADGSEKAPPSVLRSPLTDDPRSTILLRYDCESEVGRREVTLFGDGTVRLRRRLAETETGQVAEGLEVDAGTGQGKSMRLYDLDPDSLDAYRARIADVDLSDVEMERSPVGGEWVECCDLEVLRVGAESGAHRFRFCRYSSLPLEVSRLLRVANDLIAEVEDSVGRGLPPDYEPRPGDVIERTDGVRFEVVAYTSDGKGVELLGVESPLVLYLAPDQVHNRFVQLVSRREGGGSER